MKRNAIEVYRVEKLHGWYPQIFFITRGDDRIYLINQDGTLYLSSYSKKEWLGYFSNSGPGVCWFVVEKISTKMYKSLVVSITAYKLQNGGKYKVGRIQDNYCMVPKVFLDERFNDYLK